MCYDVPCLIEVLDVQDSTAGILPPWFKQPQPRNSKAVSLAGPSSSKYCDSLAIQRIQSEVGCGFLYYLTFWFNNNVSLWVGHWEEDFAMIIGLIFPFEWHSIALFKSTPQHSHSSRPYGLFWSRRSVKPANTVFTLIGEVLFRSRGAFMVQMGLQSVSYSFLRPLRICLAV